MTDISGINTVNRFDAQVKTTQTKVDNDISQESFYTKKADTASDTAQLTASAEQQATTKAENATTSVKQLTGARDIAQKKYDAAKLTGASEEELAKLEEQINAIQAKIDEATEAQKSAEEELQTATQENIDAQQKLQTAQEDVKAQTATTTADQASLTELKKQQSIEQERIDAEVEKAKTETGGTEVTQTTNGLKTTTKTTNSREFIQQENTNIQVSKGLQQEYQTGVSLAQENCLDETGKPSARTLQTESLAQVQYTPEITRTAGDATLFEDSVNSGDNRLSASTSVVRDKNQAVNYYLDKAGIEPTGRDSNGNPKYSAADIYAAEYAVSALQPDIVANAKATVEYQGMFKDGTASENDVNSAIDMLKNGSTFQRGDALGDIGTNTITRTVGTNGQKLEGMDVPLLNDNETNALISKLEQMKAGTFDGQLSQRELNALSFLKGTSDVQGFPTVPAGMEWNLPAELMTTTEKIVSQGNDIVFNFDNGGYDFVTKDNHGVSPGITKIVAQEGTPEFEFLQALSTGRTQEYHTAHGGVVRDKVKESEDSEFADAQSEFYVGKQMSQYSSVTYNVMYSAARKGGIKGEDGNYILTPQVALDYGLISQSEFDSLSDEAKNIKMEIPKPNSSAMDYDAKGLTSTDNANDNRVNYRQYRINDIINSENHISVRGWNEFSDASNHNVRTGTSTTTQIAYFDGTLESNGKPKLIIKTLEYGENISRFSDIAREGYEKVKDLIVQK